MKKVFVTDKWFPDHDKLEARIKALGGEIVYASGTDEESLIREGSDAVCVINTFTKLPLGFLKRLKNCRTIIRTGIGLDTVDLSAASEAGICVSNIPDYCLEEVADHTVALALAVMRKIILKNHETHTGKWESTDLGYVPRLRESTLGLLGFGGIAKNVARRFSGFGISIVAYDPYLPEFEFKKYGVMGVEAIEDVYRVSDIISLHMPLTDDSYHLVNKDAIAKMKDHVFIINTARGGLIDQDALYNGLVSKKIAGAGLDVMESEPIEADNALLQLENVIITPHIGYYSSRSLFDLYEKVVDEVERTLKGNPNRVVANRSMLGTPDK